MQKKFLKTKNISKAEYYIFVRLPNKIGDAIGKSEIKEKILGLKNSKVRLLNYSEMSAISEQIFFPFQGKRYLRASQKMSVILHLSKKHCSYQTDCA